MVGRSPTVGLDSDLADTIPHRRNYLLLIVDGLGEHQLSHPNAEILRKAHRGTLKAPFPTTTTVGLSSVSTATTPLEHGVIGYKQWFPSLGQVGSVLSWSDLSGHRLRLDPAGFLPSPNLWERLLDRGTLPIVAQPAGFVNTPFSKMLYRGADVWGYSTLTEINPAFYFTKSGATLAVVYYPFLDTAAHMKGQKSHEYAQALSGIGRLWARLRVSVPSDTTLLATADHGHCDIHPDRIVSAGRGITEGMRVWGDSRVLMFSSGPERTTNLAVRTGGELVPTSRLRQWLGTGVPHPETDERLPKSTLLAPERTAIYLDGATAGMVGHHGGASPSEMLIPLLVGP